MGFGTGGGDPGALFQGAMDGLLQGAASIGLNYAVQELDWDPLLANIGFSAVATMVQAGLAGGDIFKNMFNTYKDNALTLLGHNPTPNRWDERFWKPNADGTVYVFQENLYNQAWGNYYWQEAVYTSQILDFSDIIQERGLEAALFSS